MTTGANPDTPASPEDVRERLVDALRLDLVPVLGCTEASYFQEGL